MAKIKKLLSDIAIKNAKPKEKDYKVFDSGSLYIHIKTNGSKLWKMKITFDGKENTLSFGQYPIISLAQARQARDEAKRQIAQGINPALQKLQQKKLSAQKIDHSFESLARKWWDLNKPLWTDRHANDVIRSLERCIFPYIGKTPITNIDTPLLLEVLQKIEKAGAIETTHRIRQRVEGVFNYAISVGIHQNNPATVLKGALKPIIKKNKQPAITNLHDLQKMINTVTNYPARPITTLAFRLAALIMTRPSEWRAMKWEQIDGDVWTIPAEQMKMKRPHKVFLSTQALEILDIAKQLSGNCPFVFPCSRNVFSYISENAVGYLINKAGYQGQHCPHGFRASFSTIMNEKYPQDRSVIDLMLAHENKNTVEAAYNRSQHEERRRELYQIWADLLCDGLISPSKIISKLKQ